MPTYRVKVRDIIADDPEDVVLSIIKTIVDGKQHEILTIKQVKEKKK